MMVVRSGYCTALFSALIIFSVLFSSGIPDALAQSHTQEFQLERLDLTLLLTRSEGPFAETTPTLWIKGENSILAGMASGAEAFALSDPGRIVIDLPLSAKGQGERFALEDDEIQELRVGYHKDTTRVVVELKSNTRPGYRVSGDKGLILSIEPPSAHVAKERPVTQAVVAKEQPVTQVVVAKEQPATRVDVAAGRSVDGMISAGGSTVERMAQMKDEASKESNPEARVSARERRRAQRRRKSWKKMSAAIAKNSSPRKVVVYTEEGEGGAALK
jgi:hypothetical protein